jgi:uroporphyrinogen decarboxylase
MNKRERFHAAVEGAKVDRPPVCVWMHFVTPYMSGDLAGERHNEFIRHYDWDIAKAVSDYRYPFPDGLLTLTTPDDMGRIRAQKMDHPTYANQLGLLRRMRTDLGADWPVIDTTFNPIQQVVRYAGNSVQKLIADHPGKAKPMLEAVTETMIRYMRALVAEGVDGVFYSTWAAATEAAASGYSREVFEELVRPYDIAILEEAKGIVRLLHACKDHLDLGRVAEYPHEVLSWATKDPTSPSLSQVRAWSDKCLMGGIDQAQVVGQSIPEIQRDIDEALAETGGQHFILAPGCTFGSNAPDHVLRTIQNYTG